MVSWNSFYDFWRVALSAPPGHAEWVSDAACDRVNSFLFIVFSAVQAIANYCSLPSIFGQAR